jgi:hypothetical protein
MREELNRQPGAWSDGVPTQSHDGKTPQPGAEHLGIGRYTSRVTQAAQRVSRLHQFEGTRGASSRASVVFRHVSYVLAVLLSAAVTQAATAGIRNAQGGGWFMMLSCTSVVTIGAISTLFYVNLRNQIIQRVRHYVFGIIAFPGTLLSIFLKAAQSWLGEDTLGSTLGAALPVLFLATVIIPAFVFGKEMMGIRSLHLSKLDDEEAVKLWTRQDGLSR